jgi:hypothetical protein
MDHSSRSILLNQRSTGKLSKIIDVHSHAILDIGEQVPLANQARWSVEGAVSLMDANEIAVSILSAPSRPIMRKTKKRWRFPGASTRRWPSCAVTLPGPALGLSR